VKKMNQGNGKAKPLAAAGKGVGKEESGINWAGHDGNARRYDDDLSVHRAAKVGTNGARRPTRKMMTFLGKRRKRKSEEQKEGNGEKDEMGRKAGPRKKAAIGHFAPALAIGRHRQSSSASLDGLGQSDGQQQQIIPGGRLEPGLGGVASSQSCEPAVRSAEKPVNVCCCCWGGGKFLVPGEWPGGEMEERKALEATPME
jgi:hypothetical protein